MTAQYGADVLVSTRITKKSTDGVKFWATVNVLNGIAAVILQTLFYALGYTGTLVYVSVGFWAGAFFIITGTVALKIDKPKLLMVLSAISMIPGFAMMLFFSIAGIPEYIDDVIGLLIVIMLTLSGVVATSANCMTNYQLNGIIQYPTSAGFSLAARAAATAVDESYYSPESDVYIINSSSQQRHRSNLMSSGNLVNSHERVYNHNCPPAYQQDPPPSYEESII